MSPAKKIAVACYSLVILVMYVGGLTYALTSEIMPYHKAAIGIPWSEVDAGLQMFIITILNGVGGLVVCLAVALTCIMYFSFLKGAAWSYWAMPFLSIIAIAVAMRAALVVSYNSSAEPPIFGLVILVALVLTGFVASRCDK